jgi:hypothetical protein
MFDLWNGAVHSGIPHCVRWRTDGPAEEVA